MDKKHIHFIGICGVGMSALAILWQKKGWKVTGSDAGFYPPYFSCWSLWNEF